VTRATSRPTAARQHPESGLVRGLVLGLLLLVVLAGAGFWWFVLREDAPERASLGDCAPPADSDGGPATIEGAWTIQAGDPETVFVGYRIDERFGGETISKEAAGRTGDVTGSLSSDGTTVTEATVVAQLGSLQSNRTARDTALRTKGLETDTFPEARFTLTEPIPLEAPAAGQAVEANAAGTLELHGTERDVVVPVEACWTGPTIRMSGSLPVVLADYGIPQVETPIVDIEDRGELEFELTFVPG
jgi:polyisoprenoid-binding protein YceI